MNEPAPTPEPTDVWDQLRGSFAMPDCNADPAVLALAKRYTRNPERFESQLSAVLPRLVYVQQVAAQYGVAGEFALLPWVESNFRPVRGKKHRAAGMWQIMPATAGSMGLRVDGHYDGRLDVPAATDAVMKLLKSYHDQFNDWRMADYAYNAGEFATKKFITKHGVPADIPVIPHWSVHDVTRQHLTKLLAMACIVREPDRFNVSLPTLASDEHLVQVKLPRAMPISIAADHAGMSVDSLKDLNAAFSNDTVGTAVASYLLLPVGRVQQFRDALINQSTAAEGAGQFSNGNQPTATTSAPSSDRQHAHTHTVRPGDSLWQIAHQYSTNVNQLKRWNHLGTKTLKPGQVLRVSSTN
ncbi:MAG: transglycosylase SLT domain-containing protein [Rhodanobacter sp.]